MEIGKSWSRKVFGLECLGLEKSLILNVLVLNVLVLNVLVLNVLILKVLALNVLVLTESGHNPTPCSQRGPAWQGDEIGELTFSLKSSQLLAVQQADGSAERVLVPTIVAPRIGFGETLALHH